MSLSDQPSAIMGTYTNITSTGAGAETPPLRRVLRRILVATIRAIDDRDRARLIRRRAMAEERDDGR